MKNLKVRSKLFVSFAAVLVLAIIISAVAIYGLGTLDAADTSLYERNFVGTMKAYKMLVNLTGQRSVYRDILFAHDSNTSYTLEDKIAALRKTEEEMKTMMDEYATWARLPAALEAFGEFKTLYDTKFSAGKEQIIKQAQAEDYAGAYKTLDELITVYADMAADLGKVVDSNVDAGHATVVTNTALYNQMLWIQILMLTVVAVIAVFVAIYIAVLIAKPLRFLQSLLHSLSSTGQMQLENSVIKMTEDYALRKDEIGQIARSVEDLVKMLNDKVTTLEIVSNGDLTTEIGHITSEDTIGNALQQMVDNMNQMFSEINTSSDLVSTGAKQIADGSQALAQGTTEQASAVEQLSSSISDIADKTNRNANMAQEAAELSDVIKSNAEKGSMQMEQMMLAVQEINDASSSISKVIKVIDDIAFQTNILALNASVEAARAGQHGRGFAVVAEEVRTLAAKSAEAAKDTGSMIENSIDKANHGLQIANATSQSLRDIVEGINRSANIVSLIAQSSNEQAAAITQINLGIDQVAQVVQQNSATAQESAAASEEMSGQSSVLQELISQFTIKDANDNQQRVVSRNAKKHPALPQKSSHDSGDSFGKY